MSEIPHEDEDQDAVGVEAPQAEEHPDDRDEGPGEDDYEDELRAAEPGSDDEVVAADEEE